MVSYLLKLRAAWFSRSNAHFPVKLPTVGRDDLRPILEGNLDGEASLATGSGSTHYDEVMLIILLP